MALFYITGIAGTGKSTIWRELKARGYKAYDVDEDGFAKWHNDKTGYVHPKSSVKKEQRTPEFLQQHSWKVTRQEIQELSDLAESEPVFLCGVVANESEIRNIFTEIFALVIDEETLKYRLANRTDNDWGKQPHELEQTLSGMQFANDSYRQNGYTIIDATKPLEQVVDEILSSAKNHL